MLGTTSNDSIYAQHQIENMSISLIKSA